MSSKDGVFFDTLDYFVFGLMLCLSGLIGVYFAWFAKKKQNTTNEYLMGGKTMGIFPISMSLIASYISGISLLGLPAEMYTYGTQYWMTIFPEFLLACTMAIIYLPVFYKLQITSSYEYLKLRFNHTVRVLGSIIFVVKMLLYIPIVIYVPALAFSQVTGINLHHVSPIVCAVCIFYTTLGGLKAVVWTDTLQTILMVGGVIFVMIYGTIAVGGPGIIYERAESSGRIEFFNFDINPLVRHTFWTTTVGNYFSTLAGFSVNQAMVQRCLALPSLKMANITIGILSVGIVFIVSMCCYTGLVIYATYYQCDPLSTGAIKKSDSLLPYFVIDIAGDVPGLPGIFLSGVFSAALSTMSTGLNSMTGVIFEDLIRPLYNKPISEEKASFIMKITVFIIGTICVGMVFLVEKMGTLIQAAKSLQGITAGTLLGLFSLGMFFPWSNAKGAIFGGVVATSLVAWISIGTQTAIVNGIIVNPIKPVSTEGCDFDVIPNTINTTDIQKDVIEPFPLYKLSYLYYTMIGSFTCITVGLIVSFLTEPNDPGMIHRDLITPVLHRFLPKQSEHCKKPRLTKDNILLAYQENMYREKANSIDGNVAESHEMKSAETSEAAVANLEKISVENLIKQTI